VDAALAMLLEQERPLLTSLSAAEHRALADTLRTLLTRIEAPAG
jgi:hypothetical protein